MRINVYAEELPTERSVEVVKKETDSGRTFYGVRIYLKSPKELHDPHINTPPQATPSVAIWLDRNPKEQARSQAKFTNLLAGMPLPDRAHMLRWRKGLITERMAAREALRKSSRVILTLSFETILMNPRNAAWMLADALKQWTQLDAHAMSLVVARRGPECKPDLSFEIGLLRQFT